MNTSDNKAAKQIITPKTIVLRSTAVLILILAIAYVTLPFDFDAKGIVGFIDDFFFFMAAFTLLRASFTQPERRFIKRQLYIISTVCFIMGFIWLGILATLL